MQLRGAKVLVTGGSRGIGRGIAEVLKAAGSDVTITARHAESLEIAAKDLGVDAIAGDVGDERDVARTMKEFLQRHDRLDVLVNNAGIGFFAPLLDTEREDFLEVLKTNVLGPFLMAREAARQFLKQGSGNLVNISSTSGLRGGAGTTAYTASKFALRGMTECWRDELRRHNVRVILVNPSEVQTGFARTEPPPSNPRKLRPQEVAHAVRAVLEMDDRGFVPEFSVFATNPF